MWNTIKPPTGHCGPAAGGASWPPGGHVVIRTESPVDHIRIEIDMNHQGNNASGSGSHPIIVDVSDGWTKRVRPPYDRWWPRPLKY